MRQIPPTTSTRSSATLSESLSRVKRRPQAARLHSNRMPLVRYATTRRAGAPSPHRSASRSAGDGIQRVNGQQSTRTRAALNARRGRCISATALGRVTAAPRSRSRPPPNASRTGRRFASTTRRARP